MSAESERIRKSRAGQDADLQRDASILDTVGAAHPRDRRSQKSSALDRRAAGTIGGG